MENKSENSLRVLSLNVNQGTPAAITQVLSYGYAVPQDPGTRRVILGVVLPLVR